MEASHIFEFKFKLLGSFTVDIIARGAGREGHYKGGQIRLIVWLAQIGMGVEWFSGMSQLCPNNRDEGIGNN